MTEGHADLLHRTGLRGLRRFDRPANARHSRSGLGEIDGGVRVGRGFYFHDGRERGFGRSVGGADPAFGSIAGQAFFDPFGGIVPTPFSGDQPVQFHALSSVKAVHALAQIEQKHQLKPLQYQLVKG
ncbi:hypothetical protein J3P95_01615 [Pseudomonas sp. Z5-35]|uniref:hypothetical protein n=1 Tax=unclassified Pseudomonas TaxID=196821 RepID=UPI003DA84375